MLAKTTAGHSGKDQRAKFESIASANDKGVIDECWSIASTGITELLPIFFSQLDDDLFRLSEKAETNAMQSLLFEAMRFIRREREGMQMQYMQGLMHQYDGYWVGSYPDFRAAEVVTREDEEGFSLIDEAVLEEMLAVKGMVEKGNVMYQAQLFPLNLRFCRLSGKENKVGDLPVSPDVLCRQFSMILGPMEIDLKVKLLSYKIFDRQILSRFGNVYQNLNSHLSTRGVLPTISYKIIKQDSREYPDVAGNLAQLSGSEAVAELSIYLETFRAMQSLVDSWRQQLGMPSLSSAPGESMAGIEEVVDAIDKLQHRADQDAPNGQPVSTESLKQSLLLQLGKVHGRYSARTIGRPEEDTIDMVGIIFDYILEDKDLSPSIQCLIARLQIPIIKVAILDKTFFAKKNHISRVLLNDLAQAGVGLSTAEVNADNPIIRKIEEIVMRIINEFDQDIALFDELQKDFSAFMEKESRCSKIAENRTLQTTQSKEKVWLAKKAVALEITLRLQNVDAPVSFRTFIYNDWKDVLFLAYLRRDKNDEEWEHALANLDRLVWSITPPANAQERTNLIREIPVIVKAVKEGLDSISLDIHQIRSILKDLEICHMNVLRPGASLKHSENSSQVQDVEVVSPTRDVPIKDAELAKAMQEIESYLPDISNIDMEEVIMGNEIAKEETSNWLMDFVQDEHTENCNRLKVGDWIEYLNEASQLCRAKLSWKSPATSLCVFVNRYGIKVLELRLNDLVLRMRQGRANIVAGANIPLMDRAVFFLTQSLQNPFAKPADLFANPQTVKKSIFMGYGHEM
ncbi:MAG: DUF1631 domain-containing protein [Methylococcaceae bacterium]|nr:DUF1631 domain-containing protein [Methylococcaceae bacterium]